MVWLVLGPEVDLHCPSILTRSQYGAYNGQQTINDWIHHSLSAYLLYTHHATPPSHPETTRKTRLVNRTRTDGQGRGHD